MPPKKKDSKQTEEAPAAKFGRVKNTLRMGIVGLPNVGKSSLFNLLSGTSLAEAANFPFCTIDPNEARCPVPDERFEYLANVWGSPRVPAWLNITDIAGLVKGASEGAGLGNAFLSHIGAVDGIYHVVRAFDDDAVVHVDDSVDPVRDLDTIQEELCKKDLQYLEAAASKYEKDNRSKPAKIGDIFPEVVVKVREMLEANQAVGSGDWTPAEVEAIKDKLGNLCTTKPIIYLVNISKTDYIRKKNKWLAKVHKWIQEHGGGTMVPFSIDFEQELAGLPDDAAREAFLKDAGEGLKSALPKIITEGYHQLNLIHFFTAGEKEVRCWTVYKGSTAPQAAGVIHSDFERGFIKAETFNYTDFVEHQKDQKGVAEVRAAGKYRLEGKNYIVQDGDIILFQFNVTAKPGAKKK